MTTVNRRDFMTKGALVASGAAVALQPQNTQAIEPIKRPHGKHFKLSCAAYGYREYLPDFRRTDRKAEMTIMDFLDTCAQMGLDAAEPTSYYFPNPLTDEYLLEFKRKAFMLGLDISGTAIGNTFTHPAGPEREKELEHTKKWIDHAAVFGAPVIRIFAGNVQKDSTPEQAIQWCIETTKEACEYAAKKGVVLGLENHGGIVAKPEELLQIVDGVESDWFGVNFDSGNFATEDPYADLAKIAPFAVNAQIKVEMRKPGGGKYKADFKRILDILADAGYRGYIALEYESDGNPKEEIPMYIDQLRALI